MENASKGRVLVVEDEAALRRAFTRMLEEGGFSVQQAGDGRQAIDALAAGAFEVVLTDIAMPGMDGIQLLRAVFDEVAPHVYLVTETNVPHTDNISYFGDGTNEAQLVYNFALPPLTLHTFHTGDAQIISDWAKTLTLPSNRTTFFNFLASHDGIGLNPARGILSSEEIDSLVNKALEHGGLVSYKNNADGSQSPYEMNINYFDALSNPSLLLLEPPSPAAGMTAGAVGESDSASK